MNKNSKEKIHSLLYFYTMGIGNNFDSINSLVPYQINKEKLFFGPCKVEIRKEINKKWINVNKNINDLPNIFLVGVSPTKNKFKNNPKNILYAGKITKIFTFEEAWNYYDQIKNDNNEHLDYKAKIMKMINGGEKSKESPLFLEPIIENEKTYYKHRTEMHKNRWKKDLLSTSKRKKYVLKYGKIPINKIQRFNDFMFDLDCCFELTNIHFSHKKEPQPVEFDNNMLELIKNGLSDNRKGLNSKNQKPPDVYSPFGYNKDGHKYGRLKFVKLCNDNAIDLIKQIEIKKSR